MVVTRNSAHLEEEQPLPKTKDRAKKKNVASKRKVSLFLNVMLFLIQCARLYEKL